jgi:recombinational DNA repair protein RecR
LLGSNPRRLHHIRWKNLPKMGLPPLISEKSSPRLGRISLRNETNMDELTIRELLERIAKGEVETREISKVSRDLPPLLGNLIALRDAWPLTQKEQETFKAIEEWLKKFSEKKIQGSK